MEMRKESTLAQKLIFFTVLPLFIERLLGWRFPAQKDDARVPTSFTEACQYPEWAAAIDRDYNALIKRST